jgi:acetyl-CoA decarbonylase/synthase complex subunit gamma
MCRLVAVDSTYITDWVHTPVGRVPRVYTELRHVDRWGAIKARLGLNRMGYRVEPRLYAVGNPVPASPVFVTANYKLSFDTLRSELSDLDAWVMVLDTRGINVWCAAGKGTFGTDEVIERIDRTRLKEIIEHRRLILPQLGATGVAHHEVKRRSGFAVTFGPVRAVDIKPFLAAGMKATPEMRRVTFSLGERFSVAPVDAVQGWKYLAVAVLALLGVSGLSKSGFSLSAIRSIGVPSTGAALLTYGAGTLLFPILLPWLPGRAFSLKGFLLGLAMFTVCRLSGLTGAGFLVSLAWLLMVTASTSFIAMNFTGSSTYTSLSGVRKEMRWALPMQIGGFAAGIGLWIVSRFT